MKLRCSVARVGLLAAVCLAPAVLLADGSDSQPSPQNLVRAALRTELAGPSDSRKSLLNQALKIDPGFKPALWQSGRVRWDDQWLTLEQAARQADEDPTWAAYRKLRDEMIDSADGHRKRLRRSLQSGGRRFRHLLRRRQANSGPRQPAAGRNRGRGARPEQAGSELKRPFAHPGDRRSRVKRLGMRLATVPARGQSRR